MRKFGIVLQYELKEYFGNKVFMVITLLLAVVGAILLCLPRFIDMSDFTGVNKAGEKTVQENVVEEGEKKQFLLVDEVGIVETALLESMFPAGSWKVVDTAKEAAGIVEAGDAEAAFVVKSPTEFDYYIFNKGMMDMNGYTFEEAMRIFYRIRYCQENGLDFQEVTAMYEVPIIRNDQVLNKDTGKNYWYSYAFVIIVFMLIVFYGQMIAVSVTNEKSNRAIEVLVTSTTPNSLLFGKVITGAIGGLFQAGTILGALLISYRINREQWGGMLDMVFDIPGDVILVFALFGLGGYLFYAFLYGAMGALVSKTEDISKSSSGLMLVIMVVYFFSLFQLMNVDGITIKILSFLPISSYSTMFARIAMGTVAPWEVVVSFLILVASIFGVGVLGAKLYRMGTLRYGNPIKFTTALKDIRKGN